MITIPSPFRLSLSLACLLHLLASPAPAQGVETSTAIWNEYVANPDDHNNIPNCSYSGYRNGEVPPPVVPVVANVLDYGAVADGNGSNPTDNYGAFRRAIEAAQARGGGAVLVPAGTYSVDNIIRIRYSGVVLRGAGKGQTILKFGRTLTQLLGANMAGASSRWNWAGGLIWMAPDTNFGTSSSWNWSFNLSTPGGYTNGGPGHAWEYFHHGPEVTSATLTDPVEVPRGGRVIPVANASLLQAGEYYLMTWDNTLDNSLLREIGGHPLLSNAPASSFGSWMTDLASYPRWQWPVQIASVDTVNNTVTLAQPLRVAAKQQWNCRFWTLGKHVRESGVEELSIDMPGTPDLEHNAGSGWNGIYLSKTLNCWVRNVEVIDSESGIIVTGSKNASILGTSVIGNMPVHHSYGSRCEVQDSVWDDFTMNLTGPDVGPLHGINTEWLSAGNVWTRGEMEQGTFDSHRAMSFDYMRTGIRMRNTNGPGGAAQAGFFTGRRVAHWNVEIHDSPRAPGEEGIYVYQQNQLVRSVICGIRGAANYTGAPYAMPTGDKDVRLADHGIIPTTAPNLYDAQRTLRAGQEGLAQLTWPNTDLHAPGNITLKAAVAAKSGRTITTVEYLANDAVVATATSAPWSAVWSATPGSYQLKVRVNDNTGTSKVSPPAALTVGWRYRIEENHPGWTYTGGWTNQAGVAYSNGFIRRNSGGSGQTASFSFTGTAVRFVTSSWNGNQTTRLFLDDLVTPLTTLPSLGDGAYDHEHWSSGRLPNGPHTVKFQMMTEAINIDYIEIDSTVQLNAQPEARIQVTPIGSYATPFNTRFMGGMSVDPDGTIASYAWDFTNDGTTDATGSQADFSYPAAGTYFCKLTVTDAQGGVGHSVRQVVVTEPVPVASISATPLSGDRPLLVNFNGSASAPAYVDGSITSYQWDFTNDGIFDATGPTTSHTYTAGGNFTALLKVTDGTGRTATTTIPILVTGNKAPVVAAGADKTITVAALPASGTLFGSFTDDGLPTAVTPTSAWTQLSGPATATITSASSPTTVVSFSQYGAYTFQLTVNDTDLSSSDTVVVTVSPGGITPRFVESGGSLAIEAEHYHDRDPNGDNTGSVFADASTEPDYVGRGYLNPTGGGANDGTWATSTLVGYNIKINTAGTYNVWVRRIAADTGTNSIYWGVDGVQGSGFDNNNGATSPTWVWVKLGAGSLTTGDHRFEFRRREFGYKIDRFLLTTSSAVPSGQGPAESLSQGGNVTVLLDSPVSGATFVAPAIIPLTAWVGGGSPPITKVEFYNGAAKIGELTSAPYTFAWSAVGAGTYSVSAKAFDSLGAIGSSPAVSVTVNPPVAPDSNTLLTYLGSGSGCTLSDVYQLSDNTIIAAGRADNLNWVGGSVPQTTLAAGGITNTTAGSIGFIAHFSADLTQLLRVVSLPVNAAMDLRRIRGTASTGQATGAMYVSGKTSGGYFVGRLNNNFVAGAPTGFTWVANATATGEHSDLQPWDVGSDGRLIYIEGGASDAKLRFRNADGSLRLMSSLRASHNTGGGVVKGVGSAVGGATDSFVSFPSDLQSWTEADRTTILPDGNGQIKMGKWPCDIIITNKISDGTPVRVISGTNYGYNGYRGAGSYRVGAVTIDRRNNHFYFGFNIQTRFFDGTQEQPDFEPAVIAYDDLGTQKWWSRCYTEVTDSNSNGLVENSETHTSLPDQYIDGLAIDYSSAYASGSSLVVIGRFHGNDTYNFWNGNNVALNPGNAFQNGFTGNEGDVHLSWVGKLRATDGVLQRATYLAGFYRKVIDGKGNWPTTTYTAPHLDGWPSHNAGWPDLTTTQVEPNTVRVDTAGRVYVVGAGPRMVCTSNAWQKLPRRLGMNNPVLDEGTSPWSTFVRVFEPNLDTLAYSSALTGIWSYPGGDVTQDPTGADNTNLLGVHPVQDGVLVVGKKSGGGADLKTTAAPAWGLSGSSQQAAVFARLDIRPNQSPLATFSSSISTLNVSFNATASSDPDGSISKYSWNFGDGTYGTGATVSHSYAANGTYKVWLTVEDNKGSCRMISGNVTLGVSNVAPACAITSPTNNAVFSTPGPVQINANATDSDGTVERVDFYQGAVLLGTDFTSPFSYTWNGVTAGAYNLTAVATDSSGASTTSAIVAISVSQAPAFTLSATADTFVRDGNVSGNDFASQNYGADPTLRVKNDSIGYARYTFLRFDTTSANGVTGAKLRLFMPNTQADTSTVNTSVNAVASTSWVEGAGTLATPLTAASGMTHNTMPVVGAKLATTSVVNNSISWYEWDISAYLLNEKAAGRHVVTLAVLNDSTTVAAQTFNFSSRESATNQPQLALFTSSSASPYDTWGNGSFANAFTNKDPSVDFDRDGLVNLLEFVLGGDPTISDSPGVMPTVQSAMGSNLIVRFNRSDESALAPQPATVKVQVSDDMAVWSPSAEILIGAESGSGPNGASYTVAENGTAPDTVTVTIPKNTAVKKFVRVVVIR